MKILTRLETPAPEGSLTLEQDRLPKGSLLAWICADAANHGIAGDGSVLRLRDMVGAGDYPQGADWGNPQIETIETNGIRVLRDKQMAATARSYELPQRIIRGREAVTIIGLIRMPTGTTDQAILGATAATSNADQMLTLQSRVVGEERRLRAIVRRALASESSVQIETPIPGETWVILELDISYGSGAVAMRVNGESAGTGSLETTGLSDFPDNTVITFWGRRRMTNVATAAIGQVSGTAWNGEATDFAVFDGILPEQDRAAWLTYLQSKQEILTQ